MIDSRQACRKSVRSAHYKMNNRSVGNESNLVNFSPDLASLNVLDKEPLLSFPFDHLYASSDCGQSLTLDKNVEISTHCLIQPDKTIQEKDAEILSLRSQNKKLKELLIYHLDLIQQQNDLITNREKSANKVQNEGTATVSLVLILQWNISTYLILLLTYKTAKNFNFLLSFFMSAICFNNISFNIYRILTKSKIFMV